MINWRHPDTFRCVVCARTWLYLPGIVLKPTAAVAERVTCWGWRDMSSLELSATGGCYPRDQANSACLSPHARDVLGP